MRGRSGQRRRGRTPPGSRPAGRSRARKESETGFCIGREGGGGGEREGVRRREGGRNVWVMISAKIQAALKTLGRLLNSKIHQSNLGSD